MAIFNYFAEPGSYNALYADTVYDAALSVAAPFLVQQKDQVIPGVTVNGTQVSYNGNSYAVNTDYINPGPNYYIATPPAFQSVWQNAQFPNAVFDPATGTFRATIDCVGFGVRVLVTAGDGNPRDNAYCLLLNQVDARAVHFAMPGLVPTAFEFAVALPVLLPGRWSYISGNMNPDAIQQNKDQAGKFYTGRPRGGFSTAEAGDIVCFGYEDAASNGHFMVLTEAPQPASLDLFNNLPGFVSNAYTISVYDSTDSNLSLHFNDSRRNDGDSGSGLGFGQLYMFTNNFDEPVGFIFGPAGTGMEIAHFIYGMTPAQPGQLLVAAISIGRFQ